MPTTNRTFSVKNGLDVANTIVLDADRNLSNVNVANVQTINSNTFITVAGLNVTDQANSARNQANAARDQANAAYAEANLKLNIAGGTINGSLNVSGNLFVTGNTTFINTATYTVDDPLIYLAANNNLSDIVDIGFVGAKNTGAGVTHTGLARDAGDATWYLFDNLADSGHENNVVDFANTSLATLRANISANSLLLVGNTVATQANLTLAHDQANTARNTANDAYAQANTARDTANGAYAQANGAYAQANGAYAQANGAYAQANVAYGQANAAYNQANAAYADSNTRVLRAGDTMTGTLNVQSHISANVFRSTNTSLSAPSTSTFEGERVRLYDFQQAGHPNYAIGVEGSHIWMGVDDIGPTLGFKWYGNTTQVGLLRTNSTFEVSNTVAAKVIRANSTGTAIDASQGNILTNRVTGTEFAFLNGLYTVTVRGGTVQTTDYTFRLPANGGTDGFILSTDGTGNTSWSNSIYVLANNAYDQANAARDQANTARGTANDAYGQANTARGTANDAYGQANAAYLQANNAYAEANLKLNISGGTITGNLVVQGNLEILGNSTTLNVETLLVEDNEIILNSNVTGSPSLNAFVTINRGTDPNVSVKWNELTNNWQWTDDGSAFYSFSDSLNAYSQANTARDTANGAYAQANGAYAQANGAYGQANVALAAANSAANTVEVSQNSGLTLSAKKLNFVNTNTVTVVVSNAASGYANIEFIAAPQTVVNDTYTATGNVTAAATANIANGLFAIATSAYEKANSAAITVREIYATNSTIVNTFSNISTIQFDTESGMAVVNNSSNTVTIKLNSTFKYWNINGSAGLEAFGLDTVNFIPTDGLQLTANNSNTPKSLIISAPGIANNVANAANTVSISTNSAGTLYAKKLNFVNTANIAVVVSDSGDGNANISLVTTFTGAAGLMISDRFTGTGACTVFALTQTSTNDRTFVFLNGVSQKPAVDFTVNNAQLTMNVAPANNTVLEVRTFSEINLTDVTKIYSDTFTGDGTSNTFTLTESGSTVRTLVHIDGVTQRPTADYSVVGKTLTFTTPPLANTVIETRTFNTVAIGNVSSIQSDVFTGTGACTTFTLGKTTITKGAFVFIDGIVQVPTTDYSVSNNIITFTEAPEANAVVEIRSISDLNLGEAGTEIANGSHKFALTSKGAFFTNNGFSTETDSIARTYILRGTTTGNTETELFYNTSMRIPVNANTTVFYTADVVARRTDATGESAGFQIKGVVDNFSNTVSDVGDLYELVVAEDDSGLFVDARADDSNNSINIYVTGSAGKTIRWTALVNTVEVAQ